MTKKEIITFEELYKSEKRPRNEKYSRKNQDPTYKKKLLVHDSLLCISDVCSCIHHGACDVWHASVHNNDE